MRSEAHQRNHLQADDGQQLHGGPTLDVHAERRRRKANVKRVLTGTRVESRGALALAGAVLSAHREEIRFGGLSQAPLVVSDDRDKGRLRGPGLQIRDTIGPGDELYPLGPLPVVIPGLGSCGQQEFPDLLVIRPRCGFASRIHRVGVVLVHQLHGCWAALVAQKSKASESQIVTGRDGHYDYSLAKILLMVAPFRW
jgi:hypothetical protein